MVCCEQKVNWSKSTLPDINSGVATTCLRPDTSALNVHFNLKPRSQQVKLRHCQKSSLDMESRSQTVTPLA